MTSSHIPSTLYRFILYFVTPYKYRAALLFSCAALSGGMGTINSYLTKLVVDIVDNSSDSSVLMTATMIPIILLVGNLELHNLLWRTINYLNLRIIPKIKNDMVSTTFEYTHKHSYRYFQENYAGTIANNITRLSEHIEIILGDCLPFIVRSFVQLVIALFSMSLIDISFSIALLVWTGLFMVFSISFSKKVVYLSDNYAETESTLSGKITDSITSSASVKLFANAKFEVNYLWQYLQSTKLAYQKKEWFLIKCWFGQGISINILLGLMIIILVKLRVQGLVTIGDFAFIIGLTIYITDNIWSLAEYIDKISSSIGECNQALKMLIFPSFDIVDSEEASELEVSSGTIEFKNVSFCYEANRVLFNNLSVTIAGGQKVGIVGPSGAGKTSFINLITRSFGINAGYIMIDKQDITNVKLESLHKNVGFIPQDPALFHRSLMDNIRYGNINASEEEVIQAARYAHADEFIKNQSQGYNTLVGERGIKLSGGQRQRIAIARAILKNASILVMDEATSALDSITENYIQESLKHLMINKTVVVIAHRLSTLLEMDRIIVFDKGMIVQDGTHEQLLKEEGLYKLIWTHQVNGYIANNLSSS